MRIFPGILAVLIIAAVPAGAGAAVVINEILFDPAGADTGLERIELYNAGSNPADLSGWELYPDGIGYYAFPAGTSLAGHSFLTIHLRASGTGDAANHYHASPTTNMGNSSGSVALFRPGGRSADTIEDFVRYQKPGASERKTWESAAAEAGLWTAGTFVDTGSLAEGDSIGLAADGVRGSASAWRIMTSPGMADPGSNPPPTSSGGADTDQSTAGGGDIAVAPPQGLGADAGDDTTVIAGAVVEFRGLAYGLNKELIPNARFLWNFGDGWVKEGKALTHIYYFPGTYHAHLSVSSGELAGADWRMIIVYPPKLIISEVKPGNDGFVEIFNAGDARIDLAGIRLTDDAGTNFAIPANTLIAAGGVIAFPNSATWLKPAPAITLADARGMILDAAALVGSPGSGSWVRNGDAFVVERVATPGLVAPAKPAVAVNVAAAPAPMPRPAAALRTSAPPPVEPPVILARESEPPSVPASGETAALSAALPSQSRTWLFFGISAGASALLAIGVIALKRKFG